MSTRRSWVTLVTRPSYTPGVLALKASLDAVGTAYPLLVLVTSALPAEDRAILTALGCELQEIEHIPNSSLVKSWSSHWLVRSIPGLADQAGTMSTASSLHSVSTASRCAAARGAQLMLQRMAFIDADAIVIRPIDHIFDIDLPDSYLLATINCYEDKHDRACLIPDGALSCAELCRFRLLLNEDPITPPRLEPPFSDGLNTGLFSVRPSPQLLSLIKNHVQTDLVRLKEDAR